MIRKCFNKDAQVKADFLVLTKYTTKEELTEIFKGIIPAPSDGCPNILGTENLFLPHFKDGEFISCMFQYVDCLEYVTPKNIITRIIRPKGGTVLDVELDIDGFLIRNDII